MTYACRDCDTTFTAPTDTDTVRCLGCGDMVEQQPAESPPPDQTLRDRIAEAIRAAACTGDCGDSEEECFSKRIQAAAWHHGVLAEVLGNPETIADAVMPVLQSLTLRELELLARPNTPPSRPEPRIPDHTVNEAEAPAPVRQRADCTELEWAEQERARFERLYTRETVRADLAEQRAETAARDADIYQQRLERLGEGYTRERKRADEAEAHRLALSEALGLGTGAPWDAIHDRATELGLPPLTEDPVAQRLGLVPAPADRAAVLLEARDVARAEAERLEMSNHDARAARGARSVAYLLRRLAAEAQPELEADPQPVSEEFLQHLATAKVREDDGAEARQPDDVERRVYAWAQTIDTIDGGRTVRIPGVHHTGSGPEATAIVVSREDVPVLAAMLTEAQQPDTETPMPVEDPARIDRLRPEFTDHASVESIDVQLRRARAQERRWHIRVEWLIGLRAARVEQKARGEWPAVRVGSAAADTGEEA